MKDPNQHIDSLEHIGACVIILNAKKEILLGERMNSYRAGWFGMPGGRIELNEPIFEAGKREVLEEVGMHVESVTYIGVVREFQDAYNFIHFGLLAKESDEQPQNMEPDKCKEWKWYSLESLPENILPGHKAIIDMYRKSDTSLRDLI